MKEKEKLVDLLCTNAEMDIYAFKVLKKQISAKDTEMAKYINQSIFETSQLLKTLKKEHTKKKKMFSHFMLKRSIKMKVRKDDSPYAISEMILKGLKQGRFLMKKRLNQASKNTPVEIILKTKEYIQLLDHQIALFQTIN